MGRTLSFSLPKFHLATKRQQLVTSLGLTKLNRRGRTAQRRLPGRYSPARRRRPKLRRTRRTELHWRRRAKLVTPKGAELT